MRARHDCAASDHSTTPDALNARLPAGATGLAVALSGGADSCALLAAAVLLREERPGLSLRAVHVDHGLQPAAASFRQACAALCARLPLDNVFAFQRLALRLDLASAGGDIAELKAWLASHGYRARLVFVLAPFLAAPDALAAIADMDRTASRLLGRDDNLSLSTALGSDCHDFADSEHIGPEGRRKVRGLLFRYLGY